jgi:E3 ubiquitin-protein ligase RNF115/126
VISEEEFNKLEKKHYSIDNQSNSTCPITQIEFLKDEEIIELPCSHIFNPSAIKKWLMEESGECPVCRYKFTTIQVQAEQAQAEQAQAEQAQAEQAQAEQAQAEEENLRYNPTEFNDIFNNFMETTVVYVYINNNIYV